MLAKNKDYSPTAYFAARKWDENGIPADKTISI
jgi:hypothetical protein